jgi:hypothetical protein
LATQITGYIEDIYSGESQMGTPFLNIKFHTNDTVENDNGYYNIRWYYTAKTVDMNVEKTDRILQIAGVPKTLDAKSVESAMKVLCIPEIVALEVPISVKQNTYEGKTSPQYDIGWPKGEDMAKDSGFAAFKDLVAERMAKVKVTKVPKTSDMPEITVISEDTPTYDDIPF